jgi:hypothetical protein
MSDDKDSINEVTYPDMFVGRIPPFLLFEMEYHSLFALVESHKNDKLFEKPNPATEVAMIGLVAHFEAFCKHQFAAIANIVPALLSTFASRRGQATITLSDILSLYGRFEKNIGFLVAEQYDFGSAEMINGLFRDLLSVTPFSKDESRELRTILSKRNLLVHHAGIYTLQYLKAGSVPDGMKDRAFRDPIVVTTEEYRGMSDYLFEMAMKIARVTTSALKEQMESAGAVEGHQLAATRELLLGLYDYIE